MASSVEPVRTCVGCRVRAAKPDLLRVVAVAGALLPDRRGTSSGRGVHLHPDPECLALAERRRAFHRAFRLDGPLRTDDLLDYLTQHHQKNDHHEQSGTTP